jgi:hypothetical protein
MGAIFTNLCVTPDHNIDLLLSKSINGGADWTAVTSTNINMPQFNQDREYLWTDQDPSSPYYGRTYMTLTLFNRNSPNAIPSPTPYDAIAVRHTTNEGTTWSNPAELNADTGELGNNLNLNQYASLAIQPSGNVVGAWLRGKCLSPICEPDINTDNKIMWARSTDGGNTFDRSNNNIIATDPSARSIPFSSISPGGFQWSASPNITADPVDGTLYAVWTDYRQTNAYSTASVYISRGTDDGIGGISWTPETLVYDNPNIYAYQYFPWVQVSKDHVVHVTFGSEAPGDDPNHLVAYYVQSTDDGATFSPPFPLSDVFDVFNFMGDYQAMSIGGYDSNTGTIMTTWTQAHIDPNTRDRWGRLGTFPMAGTPVPTPTSTPAVCPPGPDYTYTSSTSTLVPGTTLVPGSQCNNCVAPITLPFPFTLYDSSGESNGSQAQQLQSFSTAWVSSNGNLQFESQLPNAHSSGYDCPIPIQASDRPYSLFGET